MRVLTIVAAVLVVSSPALAGNPGSPWDRPPVAEPPAPVLSWGGFYAGVGATTQKKSTTTTEYEPDGYTRTCDSGGSGHSDQKCQVSQHDWDTSPEIQALRDVRSPWNKSGLRNDGTPGEIVRYDNAGYPGIWLNDQQSFSYTTTSDADPSGSRGATLGAAEQVLTEIFTLDEDEEFTANAFAGYRMVSQSGLAGGLEFGTVGGAEIQGGFSKGRWFNYVGYNSDEEFTAGADVLMGRQGNWFVGGKFANGDHARFEGRIGISF